MAVANRRREQRKSLNVPIEIRTQAGVVYRGWSRDISPAGMGAISSVPLEVGAQVWVKYDHPFPSGEAPRTIVRRAIVRQRHSYRYGFEFDVPLEL